MQTDVISEIIENKRKEVDARRVEIPLGSFVGGIKKGDGRFRQAVIRDGGLFPKLIAELKFASPSSGRIRDAGDDEVLRILGLYDKYASAVSVLTDEKYFGGSFRYLSSAKENTGLPVLRKDFIIDEYQIYESRYYGADAVLLIVSVLDESMLKSFIKIAKGLGMDCLVEVHDKDDLDVAIRSGADIIGINNRDLKTMTTDLNTTIELSEHVPSGVVVVSESGVKTKEDVVFLQKANIDAVLVGTAIMGGDIEEKLKELSGAYGES